MKRLSGVSYNPEAERIVQSGTTRRTRSADARLGRAKLRRSNESYKQHEIGYYKEPETRSLADRVHKLITKRI